MKLLVVVAAIAAGILVAEASDDGVLKTLVEVLNSPDDRVNSFKQLLHSKMTDNGSRLAKLINTNPKRACPVPHTDNEEEAMIDERVHKKCEGNSECEKNELCCPWFRQKHCMLGIPTKPRPGKCPAIGQVNDGCVHNLVSCQFDEECLNQDEKCCENTLCHYKECLSIRQNIACPVPKTAQPTKRDEKRCVKDIACKNDEKCCDWFGDRYCLKGISTIQKKGWCPNPDTLPEAFQHCRQDFVGCFHDAECTESQSKCCYNSHCKYHQCMDMNLDFACPTINLESEFQMKSSKKKCETTEDCGEFTSLCCDVAGKKECRNGIHIIPKEGDCPNPDATPNPKGGACDADSKGECEYDSQCPGDGKCCMTQCNHRQCVNMTKQQTIDGEDVKEDGNAVQAE